jgi:hypothetical protein
MQVRSLSIRVLSALSVVVSVATAQSFTEGFEPGPLAPGVGPVPAAWTALNVSPGGPGTNPNWQVRNDGVVFPAFAGTTYAFANYNSSTGGNDISNWLMSPVVAFNNGDTISFYTRTVPAPAFPDRLELVFNTTGSTNPVDFTNVLLTVNPTLTTTGYPTTWTQFTGTISGLSGTTSGRFAFHYNPTNGGPLGVNSDYIGVDEVVYTSTGGGTLGTNTNLGQGCYSRFNSFYELFGVGANDLSNTSWTLTQNGSGGYDVTPGGPAFAPPSGTATTVPLTDDSQAAVGSLGVTIGSNGWVATGAGNSNAFTPDVPTLLGNPSSAVYFWHDMNPASAGSGQVFYEETGPTAVITYNGVYDFGGTTPSSIRVEMIVAGPGMVPLIQVGFGSLSAAGNGWLVGYSQGGASNDPGPVDISASTLISTSNPEAAPLALTANTRPVTGTSWDLAVSNGALLDLIILGTTDPNIPDLFFLGLPGCGLRASLDLINVGSTTSVAIPNNASLVGATLYANGASLAPGVNSFGALTSNGIEGMIGDV